MKQVIKNIVKISLWSLFFISMTGFKAGAAVREGSPGETIAGEYAVIVNTDTKSAQSTGTLFFDSEGSKGTTVRSSDPLDEQTAVYSGGNPMQADTGGMGTGYSVGEEKYIHTAGGNGRTYVCIGIGEHCYVWMEKNLKQEYDAAGKTALIAKDMAGTYDGQPFKLLNAMAGGEIPCLDQTGKLSILLETLSGASGVYKSDSGITAIHINTPSASAYRMGEMEARNGLLVHEGQHALFHLLTNYDTNEPYTWLNEGISVAAMDYLWGGTDSSGWMDGIAGNTDIRSGSSLFYRSYRDSTARDYGMPYLFVRYLIARKTGGYHPLGLFSLFYQKQANCSPEVYLRNVLGENVDFSDLLTEFYTAVIALEPSGKYGFAGDAIVYEKVKNYPLYMGENGASHSLEPTAAIVIQLTDGTFTVPKDGGSGIRYMVIGDGRTAAVPQKGEGSSQNPYEISTFQELNLIGSQPGAYYRLVSDIKAEGRMNLTVTNFRGVLDGGGHVIQGLERPLVGRNSGTIQNLTIEAAFDGEFVSAQGIFAQVNEGMIKDCSANGSVKGKILRSQSSYDESAFGGIVGVNHVAGTIRGCGFSGTVTLSVPASKSWMGGIAGIQMGNVEKCWSKGSITVNQLNGSEHVPYEAGSTDSYDVYVGGIAGEIRKYGNMGGVLSTCVHSGRISVSGGNQALGQFCGLANNNVVNSSRGLAGHLLGCYGKSGTISAVGTPVGRFSEEGVLLTEEAMKNQGSYAGWDFAGEWKMEEDGPVRISAKDIETIAVSGGPVSCFVGEIPTYWGSLIINGSSAVRISSDMVSGFDSSVAGIRTARVSYLGKQAAISITVKAPEQVSSLSIPTHMVPMSFQEGELFRPGKLYLLAVIDGRTRNIYSGFDFDPKSPLTAADQSVTISYYGASVSCPVSVTGKKISAITVASKLGKTQYQAGQKLDLSELRVKLTYNNGEESRVFGADQFEQYGIGLAKYKDSTFTKISLTEVLGEKDSDSLIILYEKGTEPDSYTAVTASVGVIKVMPKLCFGTRELYMTAGIKSWSVLSGEVSGGSGNYVTSVVQENLPEGVVCSGMPSGDGYRLFLYRGTPAAPAGASYRSVYRITDTVTGESISVEITIRILASNEARMFSFSLPKSFNPGLKNDVMGVIDEAGRTVKLKVLEGTDVSALVPVLDYGADIGVTLPDTHWSGMKQDFRKPVIYTLTAPDGITKKSYTVSVEFFAAGQGRPEETETEEGTEGSSNSGGTEGGSTANPGSSQGSGTPNPGGASTPSGGAQGSGSTSEGNNTGTGNIGSGGSTVGDGSNSTGGSGGGAGSTVGSGSNSTGSAAGGSGTGPGGTAGGNPAGGGNTSGGGSSSTGSGSQGQPGIAKPQPPKKVYPKVGKVVKSGPAYYRITASSSVSRTVELRRLVIRKTASLRIPSSVSIGGYTYRVTSIGSKAFRNNGYLKKVTIGKYVTSIGTYAFQGCRNLRTLTIRSQKLRSVGSGAVKGIYRKAVIHVPQNKQKAYQKLFHRKTGYIKSMRIKK